MGGPASPGNDGPTFAPPQIPSGWIAQWDGASRKYYFVDLVTGVSQWDVPTDPAPVGGTPGAAADHPYGKPGMDHNGGGQQIITHPDGSQTIKHPDGRMEPVLPPEQGAAAGTRGFDGTRGGGDGERGLGSLIGNTLLNNLGKQSGHGGSSGGSGLGSLIGNLTHSSGHSSGGGGGSSGIGGKLASQLASNLFSGGKDKPAAPSNYHGGQSHAQPSHSGGLAGSVMGGVASFLGGKQSSSSGNFGYSNAGQTSAYSGKEPAASYQEHIQGHSFPKPSSGSTGHQSQEHRSYDGAAASYMSQSHTKDASPSYAQQLPQQQQPPPQHYGQPQYHAPPPQQQHPHYGQHQPPPPPYYGQPPQQYQGYPQAPPPYQGGYPPQPYAPGPGGYPPQPPYAQPGHGQYGQGPQGGYGGRPSY